MAVSGAVLSLARVRPWSRRIPARLIAAPAGIASIGMTLWGFTYFAMRNLFAAGRVVPALPSPRGTPGVVGEIGVLVQILGSDRGASSLWSNALVEWLLKGSVAR
ncbi:hypothetical protein AB0G73_33515 [Streptomyces sp. NPDC020719]|uniref:hypothetical protein n=1 Tax=Streptomyces sp. NPDC020719 TaxID=3154896 RepID=UPI003401BFDC